MAPAPARTDLYSPAAILLHWLIAAAILLEIGLGLRMEDAHGAAKFAVFQLHKSVGFTILVLALLRLAWRLTHRPPAILGKGWERMAAHAAHLLLYILMFALPLSGWVIISTSRIVVPTLLYGTIPVPHLPLGSGWHDAGEIAHHLGIDLLYILLALHVAGALKHHLIGRDATLARMIPGLRPGSWISPRLLLAFGAVAAAFGIGLAWLPIHPPTPAAPAAAPAPLPPALPTAAKPAEPVAAQESAEAAPKSADWAIAAGSSIRFRTSWSGQAVEGSFGRFDGSITFDPDHLDIARAEIRIALATVASGDVQRDETLKSGDWFAVADHGDAIFRATSFRAAGKGRYVASGTLRIKGSSLPISLPFSLTIDGDSARMSGSATIDRTAYRIGEGEFSGTSDIPAAVVVDVTVVAKRKR